jgi:hypothetical protein
MIDIVARINSRFEDDLNEDEISPLWDDRGSNLDRLVGKGRMIPPTAKRPKSQPGTGKCRISMQAVFHKETHWVCKSI